MTAWPRDSSGMLAEWKRGGGPRALCEWEGDGGRGRVEGGGGR
eukprot:CAMPEP_0181214256 /NCGR_PEP_ID=MMETSP1096-20121128/25350_1 /TAXON_ID=156174 ORGANISM="Chrysochromulina ericina, Strain CCMP281" /NCGR_SAMPLE_ID=MMETSP1096 /ASSEMBLY_ACC=CAM_ASM_000453 /LENGTH=42 /DNA_ID= /DNA_START= /DNA_END= /DNA_ORIENTATION=